jgi:endonuclease/exonuclease/phosphatase family metal-dependent hydrolase
MRVVSWNVHGCVGTDGRFDPARTARALGRLAPDVALLQEVGDARGRHPPIDQARALADTLGMTCTVGVAVPADPHGYGLVILTRGARRLAADTWDLSVHGREPRVCLCVEIDQPRPLLLANLHLGLTRRERLLQLDALLDAAGPFATARAPLVAGGDLNDFPPGAVTRALASRLTDAALAAARRPPRTWPSRWPLLRLDRIYVARSLSIRACAVDNSHHARTASDHLPVVADLDP